MLSLEAASCYLKENYIPRKEFQPLRESASVLRGMKEGERGNVY